MDRQTKAISSRGSGVGKDTNRQKKRKRTNDKNSQEDLGQVSARYTRKEIIFSGGIDTQICYYNVNKFETTRPRKSCPTHNKTTFLKYVERNGYY